MLWVRIFLWCSVYEETKQKTCVNRSLCIVLTDVYITAKWRHVKKQCKKKIDRHIDNAFHWWSVLCCEKVWQKRRDAHELIFCGAFLLTPPRDSCVWPRDKRSTIAYYGTTVVIIRSFSGAPWPHSVQGIIPINRKLEWQWMIYANLRSLWISFALVQSDIGCERIGNVCINICMYI